MGLKSVGPVLCNARKITHDAYREREGAYPGVSGTAAKCAESTLSMCRVNMYRIMRI